MTHQELATTAREMIRELPRTGHVERILQDRSHRPVYLSLLRRNEQLQLVIGHRDTYPCLEDADAIARHFGIGQEVEAQAQLTRLPSQDGASVSVRCMAYRWTEAEPVAA